MEVHLETKRCRALSPESQHLAIDPGELRSLLTSLSHELCRPLVSLRAGFDLLLGDACAPVTVEQRGHLLTMVSLCDDLLRLTRGYLDYAGLVNGSRAASYGSFSLGAIIQEIDRQFRPSALAKGLSWETVAAEPEAQVVTDASLCQQIFGNLVSNAIKYTPAGGHVRVEGQAGADDWCVAVIDDGPGIPAESLKRVFEPFFRLSRDEHSRIEGNGLGLSICRELIEKLHGEIFLNSTPGAGTTVKVQFPRKPSMMMTGIIDAARPAADCKTRTTEDLSAATKPGSARAQIQ
jgi:signal transduction histidine kinase